jgi:hypothetical protein
MMLFVDGARHGLGHFALLGAVFPVATALRKGAASRPSGAKMRRNEDELAPKFSADGSAWLLKIQYLEVKEGQRAAPFDSTTQPQGATRSTRQRRYHKRFMRCIIDVVAQNLQVA